MELISLFGAGITIYCGWVSIRDDLRGWHRFRRMSGQRAELTKSGKRFTQVTGLCSISCSSL
jgi:hypothetical protein